MSSLVEEIFDKALARTAPLSVHLDLTWRCNARCAHCYLDHRDRDELGTAEIRDILDQLAAAGTLFLCLSGGEVLLRSGFFEIVEHARKLLFSVRVKTNGTLIGAREAARLGELAIEQVHVSIYSPRPQVHDAVTGLPGSLERSLEAVRLLKGHGIRTVIHCVLMVANLGDYQGVQSLAAALGAEFALDPTVTPMLNGDASVTALRAPLVSLRKVFRDESVVGRVEEFCAAPPAPRREDLGGYPCSAGHNACYISPAGDVFPCVQFPRACGNLRREKFLAIWRESPELKEIRSLRLRDLPVCRQCAHLASCTRCPGLAYLEGDLRGPSRADCEKAYARTGLPSPCFDLSRA